MSMKRAGLAGALLSPLLLSGCAGAMMAMGPVALPVAMVASAPMEELGMFDGLDELTAVDRNPALRNHPALGDPDLDARQAELIRRHGTLLAEKGQPFSAANALDCSLDSETLWFFVHSTSKEDYEEGMAGLSPEVRPRVLSREAALLQGDCVEGRPEGDFLAVASHESAQGSGPSAVWSENRRRLAGTMRDGELEGELLLDQLTRAESTSMGLLYRNLSHTVLEYEAGEPVGRHLHLNFGYDESGALTQTTTSLHEFAGPSAAQVTVYAGDMLFQEYSLRDGQIDGWMIIHPVAFVQGYPAEGSRSCYRNGEQVPDSACAGLSS